LSAGTPGSSIATERRRFSTSSGIGSSTAAHGTRTCVRIVKRGVRAASHLASVLDLSGSSRGPPGPVARRHRGRDLRSEALASVPAEVITSVHTHGLGGRTSRKAGDSLGASRGLPPSACQRGRPPDPRRTRRLTYLLLAMRLATCLSRIPHGRSPRRFDF
jgi:hypothetical protein